MVKIKVGKDFGEFDAFLLTKPVTVSHTIFFVNTKFMQNHVPNRSEVIKMVCICTTGSSVSVCVKFTAMKILYLKL